MCVSVFRNIHIAKVKEMKLIYQTSVFPAWFGICPTGGEAGNVRHVVM